MIQPRVLSDKLPSRAIRDYLKSGRIFMCGEMEDPLMKEEIGSSRRGSATLLLPTILTARREKMRRRICWSDKDVRLKSQKQKILYDNPVRFFGEP